MHLNFHPEIIHFYGSFGIHSYGFFIALGIIVCMIALRYNKRFEQLNLDDVYYDIITVAILAGCFGGRFLEVLSEPKLYPHWYDWFALWDGGFSILGSIIGVIIIVPLYLKKINIPILPFFDLLAIYAPLLQSIARLGCFTAGCCYGIPTNNFYAVIYTNAASFALCNIALHPTQLYSSLLLFGIFMCMYFVFQYYCKKSGQLLTLYLISVSMERFIVDFLRAERIMVTHYFSFHQLVAVLIAIVSLCMLAYVVVFKKQKN